MAAFTPLRMARDLPVCIRPDEQCWQTAPQAPVKRWPLEREAPEQGQVTSLVEYLPGARFPEHRHPAGEEILVLSGIFSDEGGNYPAGSYLRSPAASSHSPFSEQGCLLFVKLNQFAADDRQTLRLSPDSLQWEATAPGQQQCRLHAHGCEQTLLIDCVGGALLQMPAQDGGELLVLHGALQGRGPEAVAVLPAHSWVRDPALTQRRFQALEPSRVLLKLGALRV